MSPTEMLSRLLRSKAVEGSAKTDSEEEQDQLQEDVLTGEMLLACVAIFNLKMMNGNTKQRIALIRS